MSNSVFISYRRDYGSDFTSRLHEKLVSFGFDVFYDASLHSGRFREEIKQEIKRSSDFLVVLTKNALEKRSEDEVFFQEIQLAIKLKKNIIPIFLNNFNRKDEICSDMQIVLDYQGVSEVAPQFYDGVFIPQLIFLLSDSTAKQNYLSKHSFSYLSTRKDLEKEPLITRWENSKVIKSCAFYANQIVNSDLILGKLREGVHFKFLIVDPESDAAKDAAKYKLDGPEFLELRSFNNSYNILKDKLDYINYLRETNPEDALCNGVLEIRKTQMHIPTAIMIIEKENADENSIKVDIYTYDTANPDRRSIMINANDIDNYQFFDKQFDLLWNNYSEEILS